MKGAIEVFVDDEDSLQRRGAWVEAFPKQRVVDERGRDAFLLAEDQWTDGEVYEQDFMPEHVRRKGSLVSARDAWRGAR